MSDPWDTIPEGLEVRVGKLVARAAGLGIESDLVKKYALIVIAAEEVVADREHMYQSTRDQVAKIAALEHGIAEDDPKSARKAYAVARQAHQALHTSAKSCAQSVSRFEAVLEGRYKSLQVDVAARFPLPSLIAACKVIKDFADATKPHPDNIAAVEFAKSPLSLTASGHTFVWWRKNIADYEGQWSHMYELARRWHLTDAKDIATFQRSVRKLKGEKSSWGRPLFLPCPPWAVP